MAEESLYVRKTKEKIEKAKNQIFRLRLRAANSPYDIKTAYLNTFESLISKLNMFRRHIDRVEEEK